MLRKCLFSNADLAAALRNLKGNLTEYQSENLFQEFLNSPFISWKSVKNNAYMCKISQIHQTLAEIRPFKEIYFNSKSLYFAPGARKLYEPEQKYSDFLLKYISLDDHISANIQYFRAVNDSLALFSMLFQKI